MVSRVLVAAVCCALLHGCGVDTEPPVESAAPLLSIADWPTTLERGTIRFARRAWSGFETLPSQGLPAEQYRRLAERFARRHGLAVEWVVAANVDELLRHVQDGRADIAVHHLTVTEGRKERVVFSLPLTRSREWVVGVDEGGGFGIADHTAYVDSFNAHYPDALRVPVPAETDPIGFQGLIEDGVIDVTIMDEAAARAIVAASDRVRKLRELPEVHEHAWALRRENPVLKEIRSTRS